tara:strand:- start:2512 stop:3933 length:1422 start_codon:yes stop_codon:yes gene_type:complete
MALNPFFLQGTYNEQYLVQDLINEQLKIFGVEVYYLPRKIFKTDDIIKEVQSSKFDDSFLIEAYLNNYEGYAPGSDLMTKFGLQLKNEISLTISRERYEEFIAPFLEGIATGIREGATDDGAYTFELVSRPKEGDLVYFPLGERLFEIKRVESEKPFYQLGKNYVYELQCELYEYENELVDTTIEEVDNTVEDEGYITTLMLKATARQATAEAIFYDSGFVGQIVLNDDGSGYTSIPTVTVEDPPNMPYGVPAKAVAVMNGSSIKEILITEAGDGYTDIPLVTISGGGGVGAAATASVITNGGVGRVKITDSGKGYYDIPTVTVDGPGVGQTAILKPVITNNVISEIQISNTGYGYTEAPTVGISTAVFVGIGTYVYNEMVTGETSGTTAYVRDYKRRTDISQFDPPIELRVALNTGKFTPGETIVGGISSARFTLESHDLDSFDDPYDTNEEIEFEADNILDFTESNPFGDY